mmetsp:Transcript_23832/g.43217  ORF Transcript_23832/g.43217 Transcript_23832/m.43217 type:complete len:104 (+) Transcript_23832:3-314(+)
MIETTTRLANQMNAKLFWRNACLHCFTSILHLTEKTATGCLAFKLFRAFILYTRREQILDWLMISISTFRLSLDFLKTDVFRVSLDFLKIDVSSASLAFLIGI